ncbi:AAA-domain-containing protein [Hesseltinella vesiculosa]|uniref:AAA-domain-containing protein n=1 Tax=Hesseltinella vesiculosa TaxID=101127 RepID=A0A1X2GX53_9FUNG|nr:AAA-domain-containing protein [Hesseltinella vesiculosa]
MTALTVKDEPTPKTGKPFGLERAYDALIEMISYPFSHQQSLATLGIECPKGILLYGPPGVGKTFLVSSVANQYGAKLLVIHGPELYGPYVGESEEKLRLRFKQAQDLASDGSHPVILFIDEIDALTPRREQAQSHENRMVAQLLTLMDGTVKQGKFVVVGATNRPNAIDPALRRPGRFDREVHVDAPDTATRKNLLASQMRSMPLDPGLSLAFVDELATRTNGYVAADLTALCREATYHAIHQQAQQQRPIAVTMSSFQMAMAKIGPSMHRGYQVAVEKTNWDDVGGLAEVKKQLKQAVEWPLVYKSTFLRLGLKPPRGILMYGPPGCSKTTLVKVIASISGASFLSINGAQLYSPYVGDSEKVIRETFQRARASAPSIIFLDETEAIVGKRNLGQGGGSSGDSVQERVLSTLLNEMDGVETAENVLVIGATNRPDMLDAALLRPGRFDRLIYVPPPDVDARLDILKIHSRKTPVSDEVDLRVIAMLTEYYTGADLQNICREAAMMALRRDPDAEQVTMQDFEEALATIPPSITQDILDSYNDTTAATH